MYKFLLKILPPGYAGGLSQHFEVHHHHRRSDAQATSLREGRDENHLAPSQGCKEGGRKRQIFISVEIP